MEPQNSNLYIWPSGECLLGRLIEEFRGAALTRTRRSRPDYILLPTKRQATLFKASLCKTFGAIFPPKVFSLEGFVREIASKFYSSQECKQIERKYLEYRDEVFQIILAQMIRNRKFKCLSPKDARELNLIFQGIWNHEIETEAFSRLKLAIVEDFSRSQKAIDWLTLRIEEIESLFALIQQHIETAQKLPASLYGRHLSDLAFKYLEAGGIQSLTDNLYFVGFTSVLPYYEKLILKISADPVTKIWLHAPPSGVPQNNPLSNLIELIESRRHSSRTTLSKQEYSKGKPKVFVCTTPLVEVRYVLSKTNELLKQGVPASSISILVTQENKYASLLRTQINIQKLDTNQAIACKLSMSALGGWLQLFFELIQSKGKLNTFLPFLMHPLSRFMLNQKEKQGYERKRQSQQNIGSTPLSSAMSNLETFLAAIAEDYADYTWHAINDALKEKYRDIFQLIDTNCEHWFSTELQSFDFWLEELSQIFGSATVFFDQQGDLFDLQACKESLALVESIRNEISDREYHLSLSDFVANLRDSFLDLPIRIKGEPLRGIQVLSLEESRGYPFKHVFILGASEGNFPKGMPNDRLLDDFSKRKMGLPGWHALEAREDLTFGLLRSRIEQLYLSYSESTLNEPQSPSRYLEVMFAENLCDTYQINTAETLFKRSEHASLFLEPSGIIEGQFPTEQREQIFSSFSASSLERLIHCPYRALLSRLNIEPYFLPLIDKDKRKEGEWLHAAFAAFLEDSKLHLLATHQKTEALDLLNDHSLQLAPKGFQNSALYQHLYYYAWPRFINQLFQIFQKTGLSQLKHGRREYAFKGRDFSLPFDSPLNLTLSLVGKIDSWDRFDDHELLIDFKRKKLPHKKNLRNGTSPQLVFYAFALQALGESKFELDQMSTAYWSILDAKWMLSSASTSSNDKATDPLRLCLDNMLNLLQWRLKSLIVDKEHFLADPTDCSFCDFEGLCRKNDSLHQERISQQDKLNTYLHLQERAQHAAK